MIPVSRDTRLWKRAGGEKAVNKTTSEWSGWCARVTFSVMEEDREGRVDRVARSKLGYI